MAQKISLEVGWFTSKGKVDMLILQTPICNCKGDNASIVGDPQFAFCYMGGGERSDFYTCKYATELSKVNDVPTVTCTAK